jgi:hypothetical protein
MFAAILALPYADTALGGRSPRIRAVRAKADAFVSAERRAQNFGKGQMLLVDTSPERRAFLRFDADLRSGNIKHVSLLVYSHRASATGYEIRLVETPWNERKVTYANAPALSPGFVMSGRLKAKSWKAVDVTSLIGYDERTINFALTTRSHRTLQIASRETKMHGPRLVVERGGGEGEG